ncbi:MAG: hypothetical protein ACE5QV_01405 [Fidelibacterota bacterium]
MVNITRLLLSLFLVLISLWNTGKSSWKYSAFLQLSSGKYIYTTNTSSYYFYSNFQYEHTLFNITASIPFLMQNTDLVANSGAGMLPGHATNFESMGHADNMMGSGRKMTSETSQFHLGFGDILLSSSLNVIKEKGIRPDLEISGQLKVPTASSEKGFGTGKWDYSGGISLNKSFGSNMVVLDLSYISLGDPEGAEFRDALSFGIGGGRFFNGTKYALLIYYNAYTTVLEGYDPPEQLIVGVNLRTSPGYILSGMLGVGLSETSPDFSISLGTTFSL